ncbi:MAG: hypothetical protein AB9M60_06250 [Leptothrix sp. (in: b-proteobacteria)]
MNFFKWPVGVALSIALVACGGGGGGAGSSVFGGGSTTTPVATASDLLLTLDKASVSNSGADAVNVTVTAVDGSRVAVASAPITVSVNNNAFVATLSGATTGADGKVTGAVQIGTDRSNRIITVTASTGSIQKTAKFSVVGAKIVASAQQAVIAPSGKGQIEFRLTDVNSNPMIGLPIVVTGVGVSPGNGNTDSNGVYTYAYTAPAALAAPAGPLSLDITAVAGGVSVVQTVIVQSSGGTTVPTVNLASVLSASITANPSVVSVNTSSSSNRSEIRALFLGANNAPIPNVRVRFDLDGDVNSIGGTLSSGNNVVLTDINGVASTAYIPGTRSSPTNGVTVRACYYGDDATANAAVPVCTSPPSLSNPPPYNAARTQLTVISEALAVSIGTDNTIASGHGGLTYIKQYAVMVVDSSGQAKSGVQITPSIDLIGYLKGFYVSPGNWKRQVNPNANANTGYLSALCANEDSNRNGVLETSPVNEDINGNGQLDPRKSDVTISIVGASSTDTSGVVVLQIEYAKNVATWINFKILVSAAGVSGTEGRATWVDILPGAAADITSSTPPAFVTSPYGIGDPSRTVVQECSSPN